MKRRGGKGGNPGERKKTGKKKESGKNNISFVIYCSKVPPPLFVEPFVWESHESHLLGMPMFLSQMEQGFFSRKNGDEMLQLAASGSNDLFFLFCGVVPSTCYG